MKENINYLGMVNLLRLLQVAGLVSRKEARKIAARLKAETGADVIVSLWFSHWTLSREEAIMILWTYSTTESMPIFMEVNFTMVENKLPDDSIVVQYARQAVAADLKKKKLLKQPIAKFDPKTGKVYMVHSDGTSEVVGEARKGRYSERNP